MTVLPLVIAPDELLKTKSADIEAITPEIKQLAEDMFDTMYHERGIGLAAVQVGELKRMLIADVEWREGATGDAQPGAQYVLINPEIIEESEEPFKYKEGCLSFPEQFADVVRPKTVKVRYLNLEGEQVEEEFTGLLATCIQHEIDHTNGITFVDHVSRLKRDMIIKRLTKMKKQGWFDHHHHEGCGHDHSHDHDHVHGEHCGH